MRRFFAVLAILAALAFEAGADGMSGGGGGGAPVPTATPQVFPTPVPTFPPPISLGKSAAYTVVAGDWGAARELVVNCTAGSAYSITLPAASAVPAGYRITVRREGANVITIARAGSDTIYGTASGQTSLTLDGDGYSWTLQSDGVSAWRVV